LFGEMSPGFGEAVYQTLTIIPEAPLWDAPTLHSDAPSGVSLRDHQSLLEQIARRANEFALRHAERLATAELSVDAQECLWAIEGSLSMMHASDAGEEIEPDDADSILTLRAFETLHSQQALFVLRTYALFLRLANLILVDAPGNDAALNTRREAREALWLELAVIEGRTQFSPVPLGVTTGFQMNSVFVCAEALARA
jgi:hypothetical protein